MSTPNTLLSPDALVVSEPFLREYCNGETGAGQGRVPFMRWSSPGYIMKAEIEAGICHSNVNNRKFTVFEGFHF